MIATVSPYFAVFYHWFTLLNYPPPLQIHCDRYSSLFYQFFIHLHNNMSCRWMIYCIFHAAIISAGKQGTISNLEIQTKVVYWKNKKKMKKYRKKLNLQHTNIDPPLKELKWLFSAFLHFLLHKSILKEGIDDVYTVYFIKFKDPTKFIVKGGGAGFRPIEIKFPN